MTVRRLLLALALVLVAGPLMFAAGGKEATPQVKNVTWLVWITPNLTRAFYDEVAQAFQKQNTDIKVTIVESASGSTQDELIKTRLAAGDVPDLWMNVGVLSAFADAGQLWALPASDPDLKKVRELQAFKYKGKLYSYMMGVQPLSLIFYNKKLWTQAGLSTTPKTWAEFEADCEKIKQAGLTPIITGGEWLPGWVFSTFTMAEVFHQDSQWNTDRWAGKVHFTDDNWVEATSFFKRLVDKGYFNKGALSVGYADVEQQFLSGKAVMYPMGCWFSAAEAGAKKDFDVGVFLAPTKSGALHLMKTLNYGDWAIYAKSKNPEAAYKLIKFYSMNPEYGVKALQVDGLYSNLIPPLTYEMTPLQKAIMDLIPTAQTISGMYDTNVGAPPPAGIRDSYDSFGQQVMAGRVTDVKAALKQLDDFWDKAPKP